FENAPADEVALDVSEPEEAAASDDAIFLSEASESPAAETVETESVEASITATESEEGEAVAAPVPMLEEPLVVAGVDNGFDPIVEMVESEQSELSGSLVAAFEEAPAVGEESPREAEAVETLLEDEVQAEAHIIVSGEDDEGFVESEADILAPVEEEESIFDEQDPADPAAQEPATAETVTDT